MRIRTWGAVTVFCSCALLGLAQRKTVEAESAMVTSAHVLASEAGVEVLRQGGNAVDAAVATGFALAVTYPNAGNLGGGGFMLIHLPDGRDIALDYRETAPAAATAQMYLGPDGKTDSGMGSSTLGWRASGIPGTVAGLALAHERYGSGKVTWAQVIEPARRLAADGFVVSPGTAATLRAAADQLGQFEESKRIYLDGGRFWAEGDVWIQHDLAGTLARIQRHGPSEFYEGSTAERIAETMQANGGLITRADLRNYRPVERTPLRGLYRGYEIVTMPPPSSGGVALLQMLGMLEPFDLGAMGRDSAARYHLMIEVMRRAFRDRAEYLGDPDFVTIPVAGLLERSYLRGLMRTFDPQRATVSAGLPAGKPNGWRAPGVSGAGPHRAESRETTHFSVVDAAGGAVSNTFTLNGNFGSGVTIPGTGILMNNEMDDFTVRPGEPNMFGLIQGEANAIAPGKRPLSSMTPTFVLKDGSLILVTGSPGGPTIINTVLEVITNMIDHRMPVMAAVEAPRFHHQWMPDLVTFERGALSSDAEATLQAMGHIIRAHENYEGSRQGDCESIAVDLGSGRRHGAADPRRADSSARGY